MEPKDMTLGELVCEFVDAYVEYRVSRLAVSGIEPTNIRNMTKLHMELVSQLDMVETMRHPKQGKLG